MPAMPLRGPPSLKAKGVIRSFSLKDLNVPTTREHNLPIATTDRRSPLLIERRCRHRCPPHACREEIKLCRDVHQHREAVMENALLVKTMNYVKLASFVPSIILKLWVRSFMHRRWSFSVLQMRELHHVHHILCGQTLGQALDEIGKNLAHVGDEWLRTGLATKGLSGKCDKHFPDRRLYLFGE